MKYINLFFLIVTAIFIAAIWTQSGVALSDQLAGTGGILVGASFCYAWVLVITE